MNDTTLYEAIKKHVASGALRFHMPGHKGRDALGIGNAAQFDLTEIDELDNLHFPKGCIAHSERLAASLSGAGRTFFLVNGSSCGIIAALLALSDGNSRVICARNSHVSAFKGLCLSGAEPFYVAADIVSEFGICGGVSPESVERAFAENAGGKPISAVFIVSPTYEGLTSDIVKIAEITHRYGAALIVDEAHGAHFGFGNGFPETALEQGADIAVQSWHKTLTALGQGAVLHVREGSMVDTERLAFYLSIMQTTSPSYVIMASLDKTRELLQNEGRAMFDAYEDRLRYVRRALSELPNIRLLGEEITGSSAVCGIDSGKLTLFSEGGGKALEAHLRRLGICAEMSSRDYVLLMTSFMDTLDDYKALLGAVSGFDPPKREQCAREAAPAELYSQIPQAALTPEECVARRNETIPACEAEGRISAGFITPYPPGIPIAAPGEIITESIARYCSNNAQSDEINGVEDGRVRVLLD